jgi:hypothetical protein
LLLVVVTNERGEAKPPNNELSGKVPRNSRLRTSAEPQWEFFDERQDFNRPVRLLDGGYLAELPEEKHCPKPVPNLAEEFMDAGKRRLFHLNVEAGAPRSSSPDRFLGPGRREGMAGARV